MITMWLRLELRRRWRPLLVLALLVAFATATVLAAFAGARRGVTAVDRLQAGTLPATIAVLPNQPDFDWEKIRALPEVEALTLFPVSAFGVDGIPWSAHVDAFPPMDDGLLRTIERPVILEGRLPDQSRVDEVVAAPGFLASFHRKVGDQLTLRLATPKQINREDFDPATGEAFGGPTIKARIVGVIKSPWFAEDVGSPGGVLPSSALVARYRDNLIGPGSFINALVRLKGGAADVESFRDGLAAATERNDIDVWDIDAKLQEPRRQLNHFEAVSLTAFGLAALAAAIVLVGQSVARYAAATAADLQVLRAVGLATRQGIVLAAAAPFLASLAGATLGVAGAAVASLWMPIGAASLYEPAPGFDVDSLVLVAGWVLVPVLVLAGAGGAAAFALVVRHGEGSPRRSVVALTAARLGLPVPMVVGARLALEPGRGRSAVPVRPALVGAVTGVLGVLAAFTFSAGVHDAATNPERFGQTHQLQAYVGFNGDDMTPTPVKELLPKIAKDPQVASVNDSRIAVAESVGTANPTSVTTYTYAPMGGPFPVVMLEGRLPAGAGEIVLAPGSADRMGAEVGGRVRLASGGAPVTMTVTGIGFVPAGSHNNYSDGAWTTSAGYDHLFEDASTLFKFHLAHVALRPGAAPEAVAARLSSMGAGFAPPDPLPELRKIRDVQALPIVLAGFLAVLAVGAVGHALATAVRRRRHEVAVLRALGMTRRQARWAVVVQATLLALVGLAVGVPLGVALGRTVWRLVADFMPLDYLVPVAFWALVLVGPVALLLANLLAAWPGRLAARLRIGHVLRTE
ncbi:hypothetical protein GCM10023194_00100 [Planotetraspora phitsanulokensis]|uniref:ABC3 transporter permease C-terminal domain-containing protein n=1 Tax=Planotetraspora phitsanulokensis TaxID=575192 RepID=A0A8J3XHJ8_9ACTN|nr:FtsX-like permease family protein [Planotetraspora phitsanulokensis]GII40041.1 hypothetical protein Pph01_50440 [Planotetraspora phitsanulokensis]